jgi:hypothetical protein
MALSPSTPWWSRSRGLPRDAYSSWVSSLRVDPGRPARILAWAGGPSRSGTEQFCIGSPAVLSYGGPTGWKHVGWHLIERGGWNGELHQLSWVQLDGRRDAVQLDKPGRLPELFRERVEASIVVKQFVPLAGERGVTISARRDLGAAGGIDWHTSLTRGLSAQSQAVQQAVDDALAATRAEYDMR